MTSNSDHSLTVNHIPRAEVAAAKTIGELVTLIPLPYRVRARELVNKVYSAYINVNQILLHLATLQQHQMAGTFPLEIQKSIKDPAFQFSKEFKASEDYAKGMSEIAAATLAYRRRALEYFISIKGLELNMFREQFSDVTCKAETRIILLEVTQDILCNCGVGVHADGSINQQAMPDFLVEDYVKFDELKDFYIERAISLAARFTQMKAV